MAQSWLRPRWRAIVQSLTAGTARLTSLEIMLNGGKMWRSSGDSVISQSRDDTAHDLATKRSAWACARNEFVLWTESSFRAGLHPWRNTPECRGCRSMCSLSGVSIGAQTLGGSRTSRCSAGERQEKQAHTQGRCSEACTRKLNDGR